MCSEQLLSPLQLAICTWHMARGVTERGTAWRCGAMLHLQDAACAMQAHHPAVCGRHAVLDVLETHRQSPQPAQLCPGQPAAAKGSTPARMAPTANPPGISPAHQPPSLGRRGGCRGLLPSAIWRKNREMKWIRKWITKNYSRLITWDSHSTHFIQETAEPKIYTEEAFLRIGSF